MALESISRKMDNVASRQFMDIKFIRSDLPKGILKLSLRTGGDTQLEILQHVTSVHVIDMAVAKLVYAIDKEAELCREISLPS